MSAFERTSAKSYIALLVSNNILNMMTYDLFLSVSPPSRPLIMLCSTLRLLVGLQAGPSNAISCLA